METWLAVIALVIIAYIIDVLWQLRSRFRKEKVRRMKLKMKVWRE